MSLQPGGLEAGWKQIRLLLRAGAVQPRAWCRMPAGSKMSSTQAALPCL